MTNSNESRRLQSGPAQSEKLSGLGLVSFVVCCNGDADAVLRNSKDVMQVVLNFKAEDWPSLEEWRSELPAWFVAKCAPEVSVEEAERWLESWRELPPDEQRRREMEASWSVDNWTFWMHPDERQWFWWEGLVTGPDRMLVVVEVCEWPFAWGALRWLLRASGALQVIPAEEGPSSRPKG